MTPDERAAAIEAKVARFFAGGKSWSWTTAGVTFTLSNFEVIPRGIRLTISARDTRGALPVDNPYQFFNPPTGIITGYYGDGTPIIVRDELTTAKAMVYDAIVLRAKQLGWTPA